MEAEPAKKRLIVILAAVLALALPLALAVAGILSMWRERTQQRAAEAEFGAALRQSLERAADVVLPAPTLGDKALVVECAADKFEAELQRVVRLAEGVGGSAASWNDGKTVRIVVNIPHTAETLFRESVERGVYDLNAAGESRPMVMVEVLLRLVQPATPAKKTKR